MTSIPPDPTPKPPTTDGLARREQQAGNATPDLGQNQARNSRQGQPKAGEAKVARFDAAMDTALGTSAAKPKQTVEDYSVGERTQSQHGHQQFAVTLPAGSSGQAPAAEKAGGPTMSEVEALTNRVEAEIKAGEAARISGTARGSFDIKFALGRNMLGINDVSLKFSATTLTVAVTIPDGAQSHNLTEALTALAQTLSLRHPHRTVRVERTTGEETVDDSEAPGFDPFRPEVRRT